MIDGTTTVISVTSGGSDDGWVEFKGDFFFFLISNTHAQLFGMVRPSSGQRGENWQSLGFREDEDGWKGIGGGYTD